MTHVGKKKEIVPEKLEKQCVWEEISFAKKRLYDPTPKKLFLKMIHTLGRPQSNLHFFSCFQAMQKQEFIFLVSWSYEWQHKKNAVLREPEMFKKTLSRSLYDQFTFFSHKAHITTFCQILVVFWRCTQNREEWIAEI